MSAATITSKGQVTIPKKIREKLDLKSGDVLTFEIEEQNKITLHVAKKEAKEAFGILHREGGESFSPEEMDAKVAEYFRTKYKSE